MTSSHTKRDIEHAKERRDVQLIKYLTHNTRCVLRCSTSEIYACHAMSAVWAGYLLSHPSPWEGHKCF